MGSRAESEVLTVAGREVAVSNPSKVLFPEAGYTKLDLVRYYLAVADGAELTKAEPPTAIDQIEREKEPAEPTLPAGAGPVPTWGAEQ